MRIDAHVHYTPPPMAENLPKLARREPYWGMLLGPGSVQGWATAEQMIEDMDRVGLDRVVLLGEYYQQHESCVARNDQALALCQRWPERVMAFATIQPRAGRKARDELKRCLAGGLCGVGELNPYAQGFSLADPDFLRLAEVCLDAGIPLNLHVSETVGHYYHGKSTTPLRHYYHLARRYPDLKLILAHWGGGLLFYEMMPAVRRHLKNVWYDTAASPLLYPTPKIFSVAMQCIDPAKILYGSDYPLRLYPRRQRQPDFAPFIREIDALGLPEEIYDDIMGRNAARLFGLLETETPSPSESPIESPPLAIEGKMAVRWVAEAWPQTRPIFEQFGLPWQDSPVPDWEPITQAAAARGLNFEARQHLLDALNQAISDNRRSV